MKELAPSAAICERCSPSIRSAARIVLLGGDKRGDWTGCYERDIPLADDLYDQHLRNLDDES